ncbi:hypothetical protein HCG49_02165 [Arenibacter sp. 6A1]|uniref:hypothetical protein n=1 Tax=Arenibacter sp. 6A1 TaxID=2720391 RepID=UPI0014451E2D|nr:hypothetical protein [Arenibacter sp. 6A1]NKI25362.1 hypothetical protein [Arenibacter sp. 6A1]
MYPWRVVAMGNQIMKNTALALHPSLKVSWCTNAAIGQYTHEKMHGSEKRKTFFSGIRT